jgi:PDZ domain
MRRARHLALAAVLLGTGIAATAAAAPAPTAPGTTTAPTTTTGPTTTGAAAPPPATTTAPGTTTTAPGVTAPGSTAPAAQPPHLSSLRLDKAVTAQQGHAQFLVGARTSTPATLTVRLISAKTKALVRTVTADATHPAGRVYFLIEATTEQRYQIPAGAYRVEVQATDSQQRTSNVLKGSFRLNLTPPRGRFEAYTVPLWPSLSRQLGIPPAGHQLVAAVAPGGTLAKAGLRRGDVVTAINGLPVDLEGQMTTALRTLPANKPVPVVILRDGKPRTLQVTPPPDWTPAADYSRALSVVQKRVPNGLAYAFAAVKQLVDAGKADAARALLDKWRPAWRNGAAGQTLLGDILSAKGQAKQALGAYNRARVADPGLTAAEFGRGLALSTLNRTPEAAEAFAKVLTLDPYDAAAASFRAYLLVKADAPQDALAAADQSIKLDAAYEDGYLAKGLALLAASRRADGLRALKSGLLLLSDRTRAQQIITANLEPNDP